MNLLHKDIYSEIMSLVYFAYHHLMLFLFSSELILKFAATRKELVKISINIKKSSH